MYEKTIVEASKPNAARIFLSKNASSNDKLLQPRRLDEIAQTEVEAFVRQARVTDGEYARQRGKELACQGLGHRSILLMADALRGAAHSGRGCDEQTVSVYIAALLEGYMIGREQDLLQEQSRIADTLVCARAKGNGR